MVSEKALIQALPLLQKNRAARSALAATAAVRTVGPGKTIIREGDRADFLVVILEGEVDIQRPVGSEERTIARLGKGALLGETALLPGLRRTASVRSTDRVKFCRFPAREFLQAMSESPELALGLIRDLLTRLQRRENAYLEALQQGILRRDKELATLRLSQAQPEPSEGVWPPSLAPVLDRARRLARADLPVLIQGESGTGKELLARFIHRQSDRGRRKLRSLNCAAIPSEIAEAELFGARKGAFTGATRDRPGLLKDADGGTLFLDEIGDLPLDQQAKLLRALQDGTFYPVGSQTLEQSDVRLISATHKNLRTEVAAGRFREDLYYRIEGSRVRLPPLRERRDHIPLLAHWVVSQAVPDVEPAVATQEILPVLLKYPWPGNVRELISALKEALALAEDFPRLKISDLREDLVERALGAAATTQVHRRSVRGLAGSSENATPDDVAELLGDRSLSEYIRDVTADTVRQALEAHDGVRRDAAACLGITPQNLSNYLRRLGIEVQKKR